VDRGAQGRRGVPNRQGRRAGHVQGALITVCSRSSLGARCGVRGGGSRDGAGGDHEETISRAGGGTVAARGCTDSLTVDHHKPEGHHPLARDLTVEERVRAQEAIERVYFSHQIGAVKRFEEAVPRGVIEQKVRRYLEETAVLRDI